MKLPFKRTLSLIVLASFLLSALPCAVGAQLATGSQPQATAQLFAVQIRTGSKWDAAKPPQDQPYFKEHSANLKRLRDAGHLIMGARYSDIGLVVLAAESEGHARAMMDGDPSFKAEVFSYEVHAFHVFYSGTVEPVRGRR